MAAGLEQIEGADDVCLNEIARATDRAIDVRFRGEVQDMANGMLLHDTQDFDFVAQIDLFENVFWMPANFFEIGQVSGIGQAIEIDQSLDHVLIDDMLNQVRTDETGAAGYEEFHAIYSFKSSTEVAQSGARVHGGSVTALTPA